MPTYLVNARRDPSIHAKHELLRVFTEPFRFPASMQGWQEVVLVVDVTSSYAVAISRRFARRLQVVRWEVAVFA